MKDAFLPARFKAKTRVLMLKAEYAVTETSSFLQAPNLHPQNSLRKVPQGIHMPACCTCVLDG